MKRKNRFKTFLVRVRKMIPGIAIATAACSSHAAPPPPVLMCSYPLNDLGALATALGAVQLVMTAPEYQSFNYNAVSVGPAGITLAASPATLFSYTDATPLVPGVNTIFELQMTANTNYTSFFSIALIKLDASNTPTGNVRVGLAGSSGSVMPVTQLNSGSYSYDTGNIINGPILNQSIMVYVKGDTGEVGWTLGTVNKGLIPGFVIAPTEQYVIGILLDQGGDVVAGSNIAGTLVTSAALILDRANVVQTFTGVVCKDLCGTTL